MKISAPLDPRILQRAARTLRAMSHPARLRLVELLRERERTVSDLMRLTGLSQVEVSRHLAVLKRAGVVHARAQANHRIYSILNPNAVRVLDCIRQHGGRR